MKPNLNDELLAFYNGSIRLGANLRQSLAGYRDANLERIDRGLKQINEEAGTSWGPRHGKRDQGGYAMNTLNQHANNDYDIDTAVIFKAENLPASALDARKTVWKALCKDSSSFSKDPECRTNAVTAWYAAGHHVDLAVYRQRTTDQGVAVLEHAGADWSARDPVEVTNWFSACARKLSPTDNPDQFRRVVRYLKWFANSRRGWKSTGGLILSALASECYQSSSRDDEALYQTLRRIHKRVSESTFVANPVSPGTNLVDKAAHESRLKKFGERCEIAVDKLGVLFEADCSKAKAISAWNYVFKSAAWKADAGKASSAATVTRDASAGARFSLQIGVAYTQNGAIRYAQKPGGPPVPKGVWLCFSWKTFPNVTGDYGVRWHVENSGDEATAANDIEHKSWGSSTHWERTAYKGNHRMTCELVQDGAVVARASRVVPIQ